MDICPSQDHQRIETQRRKGAEARRPPGHCERSEAISHPCEGLSGPHRQFLVAAHALTRLGSLVSNFTLAVMPRNEASGLPQSRPLLRRGDIRKFLVSAHAVLWLGGLAMTDQLAANLHPLDDRMPKLLKRGLLVQDNLQPILPRRQVVG